MQIKEQIKIIEGMIRQKVQQGRATQGKEDFCRITKEILVLKLTREKLMISIGLEPNENEVGFRL